MIYATLTEMIEASQNENINHRTLSNSIYIHDKKSDNIIRCPFNNLIAKYRDLFDSNVLQIQLNEEEQERYRHDPRKLSYDLYKTPNYWSIILYLNEVGTALDFEPSFVKLLLPETIKDVLNEVLLIQESD